MCKGRAKANICAVVVFCYTCAKRFLCALFVMFVFCVVFAFVALAR